jgi:hypothetical protein
VYACKWNTAASADWRLRPRGRRMCNRGWKGREGKGREGKGLPLTVLCRLERVELLFPSVSCTCSPSGMRVDLGSGWWVSLYRRAFLASASAGVRCLGLREERGGIGCPAGWGHFFDGSREVIRRLGEGGLIFGCDGPGWLSSSGCSLWVESGVLPSRAVRVGLLGMGEALHRQTCRASRFKGVLFGCEQGMLCIPPAVSHMQEGYKGRRATCLPCGRPALPRLLQRRSGRLLSSELHGGREGRGALPAPGAVCLGSSRSG